MNETSLRTALRFLESWLEYRARQVDIPGFTVAISYHGKIIFSEAYGLADIENREQMSTNHLFGVASQSKMFTATAILQLAEQGTLTLSDSAIDHLPWLAGHRDPHVKKIMVRHLLSHSAGFLRDGDNTDFWQLTKPFPDSETLRSMVLESDLLFAPGMQLKYSNLGYALLGQIIEAASGQTFEAYITQNISDRLNLKQTYADYSQNFDKKRSKAYGSPANHRRAVLEPRLPTNAFAPAVGIHTTAEDMCQFMHAQTSANEILLKNSHKHEARRTQISQDDGYDEGAEFGYGFEIHHVSKHRLIGHDGHLAGFCTATLTDEADQLTVSVMANCRDAPSTRIVYGIFEILDWFIENASAEDSNISRLDSRFFNATTSIEVIAAKGRTVAFDPDDWQPLIDAEELSRIDEKTLKVTTPGSAFNGGEKLQYHFADDIVQAVNYAGFTMQPERKIIEPDSMLTFADLEQISLRIGKIIDVKPAGNGSLRATIDFGPGFGETQSLIHNLPNNPHYEWLKGQMILGGIFPYWHTGRKTEEIVVLGLTDTHNALAHSPLPGTLFTLEADPSKPRIYSSRDIFKKTEHFPRKLQHGMFILQGLPEYTPEGMDETEALSLKAWLQGKHNKSFALMRTQLENLPFWLEPGFRNVRILPIDELITEYQMWQIEHEKRVCIPNGDTVYLIRRKHLEEYNLPLDFRIWDENRVIVNSYAGPRWKFSSVYNTSTGADLTNFLQFRQKIINLVRTKGQMLSAR